LNLHSGVKLKNCAIRDGCHRNTYHDVVQITRYEFREEVASCYLTLLVKAINLAGILEIGLRHLHKEAHRPR
jgi:hypothetical protein